MCIGVPMQVLQVDGAFALCHGRGERRRIRTVLVGEVSAGDWLLVFLDDARERIDAQRAAEVNAALDLLEAAMQGDRRPHQHADFVLPSQMSAEEMRALTGAPYRPENR